MRKIESAFISHTGSDWTVNDVICFPRLPLVVLALNEKASIVDSRAGKQASYSDVEKGKPGNPLGLLKFKLFQ
jgi:hypothetical protein